MSQVLLDTSIVIAFLRNDPSVKERLLECEDLFLPLFVVAELLGGVQRSPHPSAARQQIEEFVGVCEVLMPDLGTAELYAQIEATLRRAGRPLPVHDVWVAALARQHQLPLATRDAHFAAIGDLATLTW
jgi:predicted nucleic acid-binding protein